MPVLSISLRASEEILEKIIEKGAREGIDSEGLSNDI